jgi:hypothetical protein
MSRPRKPTAILEASGAFIKDPQRRRPYEPRATTPLGSPPERLEAREQEIWYEIAAQLAKGVGTGADRPAFEVLVCLMAMFRHERGKMNTALVSVLISLLGKFGLTPADRSKISVPPDDEPDTLEEFLQ